MKGITLTQPWASLVALGHKRVETRSWRPLFEPGRIAIQAAKGFPKEAQALIHEPPFSDVLWAPESPLVTRNDAGMECLAFPIGEIVATAHFDWWFPTGSRAFFKDQEDGTAVAYRLVRGEAVDRLILSERECQFGNYAPGRYGWVLSDIRPLDRPIACRGYQGLWEVPPAIASQLP